MVSGGGGGKYSESTLYDSAGNIDVMGGRDLEYEDMDNLHAVLHINDIEPCRYDAAGNQYWRSVDGTTHTLICDGENRLVQVSEGRTRSPNTCTTAIARWCGRPAEA